MANQRKKGGKYEQIASFYLQDNGLVILDHNFHDGRRGEIDLIADDHGTMVFVEVKYRSSHAAGYAEEAVTPSKQRTICQTARYYLFCKRIPDTVRMRFDVIAITKTDIQGQVHIRWIRNAFDAGI